MMAARALGAREAPGPEVRALGRDLRRPRPASSATWRRRSERSMLSDAAEATPCYDRAIGARVAQVVDGARRSAHARRGLPDASGAFVTVKQRGELRGCLGTLECRRGLGDEVARCAADAASEDPRFPPVSSRRAAGAVVEVSVLGPLEPIDPLSRTRSSSAATASSSSRARGGTAPAAGRHRVGLDGRPVPASDLLKAGLPPDAWQQRREGLTGSSRGVRGRLNAPSRRPPVHRRRAAARRRSRGGLTVRGAADLHQVGRPVARAAAAGRGDRAVPPPRRRDRHPAGRRAQQLPDQHRGRRAGAARAVDRGARRGARSRRGARPRRPGHASRARTRPAPRRAGCG